MHCICMLPDVLLSVFGKVSQHIEWNHTNGNVVLVRPDLYGDQDHTCVQVIFKNLPLDREKEQKGKINNIFPYNIYIYIF